MGAGPIDRPTHADPAGAAGRPLLLQPERLRQRLKDVPAEPGCYLMRDGDDRILYIGKAKVLRHRVRSYFQSGSGHGHSP
ncbi:MAG: GIY-YIG nuclease family protein, partial [Cyanobacteriota bacterium]